MNKIESIIVGVVAGFLCPLLVFILFWWTSAAAAMYGILRLSESGIAVAALTGLALGILLDVVWLKRWIARFYSPSLKPMGALYLFCSAVALAFFMGLPLGNLALGTLAGVYVGRREYHASGSGEALKSVASRTGIFTASVTGVEALFIGLLALNEPGVVRVLQAGLGMDQAAIAGPMGVGLIVVLCLSLMIFQFWCTRVAAHLAFGRGRTHAD